MKKLLLSLLLLLSTTLCFSQFIEPFENTTGPNPLPSTNWSLSTGNWTVFDNGVGNSRWNVVTTSSTPPLVFEGNNSAFVGNESNIGMGNTSSKWLVSPLLYINSTGSSVLSFFTRTFVSGEQGTVYKIKIAPAISPISPDSFSDVVQWTETNLASPYDVYQQRSVDLSAYAGFEVYIAFVKEYTQTTATPNDDRWYIDDVSFSSCPWPACSSSIFSLVAFIDANNNGIKDSGEGFFNRGYFNYDINNSGVQHFLYPFIYASSYLYDNNVGNFYDFNFTIDSDHQPYYSCTTGYTHQSTVNTITTLYFPVRIVQPLTDANILCYAGTPARAGSISASVVVYENNGTTPISNGTITFTKDPNVTMVSGPSGSVLTPTGLTYNFTNLLPGQSRYFYVSVQVPPIPTVSIGQLLTHSVSIQANNDAIASNNSQSFTEAVVASYDPNLITESHGEKIVHSTFTSNDYLYYTIMFENTGNSYAQDIRVEELLDNDLEASTFEMLNSSHNVNTKRLGNQLTWNFDNINLPPTLTNPNSSHGYIHFRIKPKSGYAIGDIIPNTASIYFDSNPAIVTNTFNTEFVQALGTATFNSNSIALYPNPANTLVNISNNGNERISKIAIYEISGKKVFSLDNNVLTSIDIDISQFTKGLYLIKLTSENNTKVTKKLILN